MAILYINEARAGTSWLTRRYVENSLMKLSAFKQSPSKIIGSALMGFPSCWAGWALLPPPCSLPPGTLPPPPAPRGPPPYGPAPPVGVLDCIWVVMAVAINMLVLVVSGG